MSEELGHDGLPYWKQFKEVALRLNWNLGNFSMNELDEAYSLFVAGGAIRDAEIAALKAKLDAVREIVDHYADRIHWSRLPTLRRGEGPRIVYDPMINIEFEFGGSFAQKALAIIDGTTPSNSMELKQFKCPDDGIFKAVGYDNPVFYADIVANCPKCGEKCWEATDAN